MYLKYTVLKINVSFFYCRKNGFTFYNYGDCFKKKNKVSRLGYSRTIVGMQLFSSCNMSAFKNLNRLFKKILYFVSFVAHFQLCHLSECTKKLSFYNHWQDNTKAVSRSIFCSNIFNIRTVVFIISPWCSTIYYRIRSMSVIPF